MQLIELSFLKSEGSTTVVMVNSGISTDERRDAQEQGWHGCLGELERLVEVARERGVPAAPVSLAWLLHKPAVTTPIIGATKLQHIDDAIAATKIVLSHEEMARLEQPYRPHPLQT